MHFGVGFMSLMERTWSLRVHCCLPVQWLLMLQNYSERTRNNARQHVATKLKSTGWSELNDNNSKASMTFVHTVEHINWNYHNDRGCCHSQCSVSAPNTVCLSNRKKEIPCTQHWQIRLTPFLRLFNCRIRFIVSKGQSLPFSFVCNSVVPDDGSAMLYARFSDCATVRRNVATAWFGEKKNRGEIRAGK